MKHGLHVENPPSLAHAATRALYEHWMALGIEVGGLPSVRKIDPLQIRGLLPNIWILEVEQTTHRFRVRLAGEEINHVYGRNIAGSYFADIFPAKDVGVIVERYSRALGDPAVFHAQGNVYAAAGRLYIGERLGLPMLGRSGETDTLLGATYFGGTLNGIPAARIAGDIAEFHAIAASNHNPVAIFGP